jgi:hypothetical protein
MFFAVVELSDFAIFLAIVAVFSGASAASVYLRFGARDRLARVEHKLDLILAHLGLEYAPFATAQWQELAADPYRKIAAIKAYREQHGVGLAEAKRAVEDHIQKG